MKFPAFVGPSYTSKSSSVADEECINLFAETNETPGAQAQRSYYLVPGLKTFSESVDGPVRGSVWANGRLFVVAADALYEVFSDGTKINRGTVANDGSHVSMVASNIQLMIASCGYGYCYTLATNILTDVTSSLVGTPLKVEYSDGYFIVMFANSNKFQMSDLLDGLTWPGLYVNAVSVFPENLTSIIINHRELWVCGSRHMQPYQNTGSDNVFDVIPGALVEKGVASTFGIDRVDNTIFWVDEDERGGIGAWRASGYTPQRISTHAVEVYLSELDSVSNLATYTYQDGGHLFWVLYMPGADCSWVYDVAENMWHKRASWDAESGTYGPHKSWNHVYAFGKHLVGDWDSGKLYEMSRDVYDEDGAPLRWLRRTPTLNNELKWIYYHELTVDFAVGEGPQPPLLDGSGNPRPPQAMLRWSDNKGKTWSNSNLRGIGMAGEYNTRVVWRRLGRGRARVFELTGSDPVPWAIIDAYGRAE